MTATPPRHQVERSKARAHYERDTIHAILDAGRLAHVGFCVGDQPYVIPMLYARDGDTLLLHGSIASRLMRELGKGIEACVSVAHLDGLVLARSHFNHAVNYRSVVAFGRAIAIEDPQQKAAALVRFIEAMLPGRAAEARSSNARELAATSVLRMEIVDASAKQRSGGAHDSGDDLCLPHWAGVVPLRTQTGHPVAEPDLPAGSACPDSVRRLLAREGHHP